MRFVILGAGLLIAILTTWRLFFIKEKSFCYRAIESVLLVLGVLIAVLSAWPSFVPNPAAQQTGCLIPETNITSPLPALPGTPPELNSGWYFDTGSQVVYVSLLAGKILQPFGANVAFSLKATNGGLLVSAMFFSLDGRIVSEIRDNNWVLNPNNYFRKNFDRSSLEVIDEFNTPVLQVRYLTLNSFKIGGLFRGEKLPVSSLYPQFPSDTAHLGCFYSVRPDEVLILGSAMTFSQWPKSDGDVKDLTVDLKRYLKPWFDYSQPDRFGIREK
ncbi:MAG TPA: hypothetical protein VMV72_07305 [Verrucomicrobiae bacterium]|nr:hypothetical protein [Verrucomicrobiae bacterium]